MNGTVDIFTQIHQAIWQTLNAYPPFTDLVDLKNRIDATADDFENFPQNVQPDALPEVTIIQGGFTQKTFTLSSGWVDRMAEYTLVTTTENLSPVMGNRIKEAAMDGLTLAGTKFGIDLVVDWSIRGRDAMVADQPAPGVERKSLRFQSLLTVAVNFKKIIRRPCAA